MNPIPSNHNFPTAAQVPDDAFVDEFNKQVYLGNAFNVVIPVTSPAADAEVPYALIRNPASNTKSLFINLRKTSVINTTSVFYYYLNPTITSLGASVIPINCRLLSDSTSNAQCYTAPVVSAKGTLFDVTQTGFYNIETDTTDLIILDPGASVYVSVYEFFNSGSPSPTYVEIRWYEI